MDSENGETVVFPCAVYEEALREIRELEVADQSGNEVYVGHIALAAVVTSVLVGDNFLTVRLTAGLVEKFVWDLD